MAAMATTTFDTIRDIPAELCAGVLVTTSVPDRAIDGEKLRALMLANGLDDALVPKPKQVNPVFAFQKACRSVETRRGSKAKGATTTVAVGEVVTNATESVYQITAEVRDEANLVIEHPKAMRIRYVKAAPTDPIRVDPLDPSYAAQLRPLADHIQLKFDAMRGRLDGPKVREILRAQFRGMHAPRWANATYFVDLKHVDKLEAMQRVIAQLYSDGAKYSPAPVFNTATVRENLRVAIGETVGDDVSKFVAALAKKLAEANKEPEAGKSAKKITQGEFERAKDERKALVKQAEAMMANYGEEIATVREALELADAQVVALLEKVE
jgi:hypothetical protein